MARPRDVDYLQPDEAQTVQVRRHTLSAMDGFLGLGLLFTLGLTGAIVAARALPDWSANVWTAFVLVAMVLAWMAVLLHWRRATSLYTVTPERVYLAYGRIRFHLLQTTYDKVTDLHVHQSLFGRIWGYGTVRVQTAGTGLALAGVVNPVAFKQAVEEQRSAFLRSLVKAAKPKADARSEAFEAPTSRWTGTPSPQSLLGGMLSAAVLLLASLVLGLMSLFIEPEIAIGAAVTFVASLITAGVQWITFRYTDYEVTDRGVVVQKGWLSRRRIEATFAKVTDVAVQQDIIPRLLGYGKITINTAGSNEAPVVFAGIADPDAVKARIDEARGA